MISESISDTGPVSSNDGQISNIDSEIATKETPLTPWEHELCKAVAIKSVKTVVSILSKTDRTFSQKVLDDCLLDTCGGYKERNQYLARELLRSGASSKAVSEDRWTPKLYDIKNDGFALLLFLLEKGADVNAVTADGDSALTLSIHPSRSVEIIRYLLQQKEIDTNHKNHQGYTALMKAVETRHIEVMKLLIDDYKRNNREILTIREDTLDSDETIAKCFGQKLFDIATKAGMVKVIKLLLYIGEGESLLMEAALRAEMEMMKSLLDSQFYNFNIDDSGDTSFLQRFFQAKKQKNLAIGDADIPVVQLLLDNGATVNAYGERIWFPSSSVPPMITAVEAGSLGLVHLMFEYGANLDDTDRYSGKTALDVAAESGKADCLQFFLSKKDMLSEQNGEFANKRSALHLCLMNEHVDCAEILLKHGYNIDIKKFLPLGASIKAVSGLIAVLIGDIDLLQLFLHRGADVNAVTAEGDFDLTLSIRPNRSLEIIALLLQQSEIYTSHKNHQGYTALMKAVEARDFEVTKLLIDDHKNKTPLDVAAESGKADILQFLLSKTVTNKTSALRFCVMNEHVDCAKILLKHGYNIDLDIEKFLPLGASIKAVSALIAVVIGDFYLLRSLLQECADVNAVTAEGDSALTLSIQPNRSLEIIALLLQQSGIDTNHKNHQGYTALMKAVEAKDIEVMKLLIDDYKLPNSETLTISEDSLDSDETIVTCFGQELFDVATLAGMVKVIKLLLVLLHIKQGESPLMEAALRADVELVKILTDSQFYDVHKDDSGATTFLQNLFQTKKREKIAIGDVDIPIIKLLLESGAKVNKCEKSWTSADPPLITAVKAGSLGLVQLMCKYGAKLAVIINSKTPLDVAAVSGRADILQFLLSKHAKVYEHGEDVTYKDSPLHLCLVNGHTNCAEILLKHGYMINVPSAAEYAIEYNNPAYLKFLLEKNPSGTRHFLYSTRQKGHTILMQKVRHDNMDIIDNLVKVHTHMPDFLLSHAQSAAMVQLLVRNGASVNRRATTTGNPVLLTLIKSGKNLTSVVQIVDFLLEKGANVNNCNFEGVTPLIAAAQTWESSELLNTLLLHGADVHKRDCKGMTAFLYAVERNYTNNAKFLMQLHGKRVDDTELRNASGSTALVLAAKHNNKTIIELLLDREADVNVRDQDGDTALISDIKHGNRTIADLLIDRGANVNVEDYNGDTALTLTARKGNVATVMKILERGTNINHQNKKGYSALIIAALNLDKEFMEVLLNAGANVNVFLHEQKKKTAISLLFEAESYYDESTVYVLMNSLLNKGASSSYLKPDALFDLIQSNQLKLVPKLVSSGFGPAELCSKEYLHNPEEKVAFPAVSPFIFALLYSHPKLACYFDGNWFLSTSDIQLQAKHDLVKEILERRDKKECVDILDEFCSQPMSLLKLSFVAVSSAIGCVPGREERVEKLPLPPLIKAKLLFKKQEVQFDIPESATPSSQSLFWHDFRDYVYDSDNSGFYDSDDYGFDDGDDY